MATCEGASLDEGNFHNWEPGTNPALSNTAENYSPAGGAGLHIPVSATAAHTLQTKKDL